MAELANGLKDALKLHGQRGGLAYLSGVLEAHAQNKTLRFDATCYRALAKTIDEYLERSLHEDLAREARKLASTAAPTVQP